MVLGLPAVAQEADATDPEQSEETEQSKETEEQNLFDENDDAQVEEIVVTGSLIPRESNNLESMSPISVVSDEEMAERGYISIGDVMKNATQNSGYSEGKSSNLLGRYTTGGQEVNMRGFGAGRTLVLVNGRRIADYPLPFGGEQNGADIGTIPMAAVSRVEILSAGASAIYGSDAVGGVVNYITKRDMEQTSLNLTSGMYGQGFGEFVQGSFVTGQSFSRGSFTFGIEAYHNEDILISDVDYFTDQGPYDVGMVQMARVNGTNGSLIGFEATNGRCAELGLEDNEASCTTDMNKFTSISPLIDQVSSFFDGRFTLNDDIELFATVMASGNEYKSINGLPYWSGTVLREDGSEYSLITRGFSADELGTTDIRDEQFMWTGLFGAKGGIDLGYDTWYWDVSYSRGKFNTKNRYTSLKEEGVRNWLLDGATAVENYPGLDYTYIVDGGFYDSQLASNIYRPVQPGEVDDLIGQNTTRAHSTSDSLTFTLTGSLSDFDIFASPVKFAIRSEIAQQTTEIRPDERALDDTGNGWYRVGAVSSKGKRNRKAHSTELEIPVLDNLDVSLAGRYDHYNDASSIGGRLSTQAKYIYRPTDWFKLRGGYSQTFRAPDMFNIYGTTEGFEQVPDLLTPGCYDGENYYCGYSTVATEFQPDRNLSEETGSDMSFGAIWTPTPDFYLTMDWYNAELKNLVLPESGASVLFKEWQCENGFLESSEQLCADIKSRITRSEFGTIEEIVRRPVNQDRLERTGFDIQGSYFFEAEKYGLFTTSFAYSRALDFKLISFAGDDPIDLTHGEPGFSTPSHTTRVSLNWYNPLTTGKAVAAGINVLRRGGIRNYLGTQEIEPIYDTNMSVAYQFSHKGQISLVAQNLMNTPPVDNRSGFWPGFWTHLQAQSAMGRAFFLQLGYQFN